MTTDYAAWVGREESRTEHVDVRPVQALAATLDLAAAPLPGEALPPGWQWLFFNPVVARSGRSRRPDGRCTRTPGVRPM